MHKLYAFTVENPTSEVQTVQICRRDGTIVVEHIAFADHGPSPWLRGWEAGPDSAIIFAERSDCIVKISGDVVVELMWL